MDIRVFSSYDEMSRNIAGIISKIVREKPDAIMCLAAGHTSLGIFREMIDMAKRGDVSFDKSRFIGLDEWTGLGRGDDGSCIEFMYNNLFIPLGIKDENIIFYNGRGNLYEECKRVDEYLKQNGPIDFMLLGMGMNGHLGLNEPGTPFDRYSHVVDLDETTKNVGQKYFKNTTKLSSGITMGMLHIKETRRVILSVSGAMKAEIVKQLIDVETNEKFPASYLKIMDNASLFLDSEAASLIA